MRVLITGVAGFLGSHLADRFLAEGWHVIGVDNFITGARENVAHLLGHRRFEFRQQDACDPIDVSGPVEGVLHLASPASPTDYLRYPIQTLRVGAVGTQNMLELAHEKHARFLLASTSEVYGDPLEHPQRETYWGNVNPIGHRGVYDEAKRFAEAMTMAYTRTFGVEIRIARIFNTYGPRMRPNDGRVVSNFVVQALRDEPLTIYGDGSQTRSFCYVEDEIDGLFLLFTRGDGIPVNIGNPSEVTVNELAEMVLRLTGSRAGVEHRQLPEDDPRVRRPDISVARKLLGWEPRIDLETGLSRTIEWFRGRFDDVVIESETEQIEPAFGSVPLPDGSRKSLPAL